MFNFGKTDAHVCLTECVLLINRVECIKCDVTLRYNAIPTISQQTTFFSVGSSQNNIFYEYIP